MQPLSSILVRTEALLLTKLEVWWYLVVKLGPNLSVNFEQVKRKIHIFSKDSIHFFIHLQVLNMKCFCIKVGVPLLLSTLPSEVSLVSPATPARSTSQSNGIGLVTPKQGMRNVFSLFGNYFPLMSTCNPSLLLSADFLSHSCIHFRCSLL